MSSVTMSIASAAGSRAAAAAGPDPDQRPALRPVRGERGLLGRDGREPLGPVGRRGPPTRRAGSRPAGSLSTSPTLRHRSRVRGRRRAAGPACRRTRQCPTYVPTSFVAAPAAVGRSSLLRSCITTSLAVPTAAGNTASAPACAGTARRSSPPVPDLVPICRSTICTCLARQSPAISSWVSRSSASCHRSSWRARSLAMVTSDARICSSSPDRQAAGGEQVRGRRPTARARPAGGPAGPARASVSARNLATNPGSLAPDRNSSSRNCTDWKPLAGASAARNSRKSCGVIVSSTSIWLTSSRSMTCTRRSRCRARQVTAPSVLASIASRTAVSSCSSCLNHSS